MNQKKYSFMIIVNVAIFLSILFAWNLTFAADDTEKTDKKELPKEITGKDSVKMVLLPAGEFQMGDSFSEGWDRERPVHIVYVDNFYMDIYLVTNEQYKKFMDATGHNAPMFWNDPDYNGPDYPVVGVSWYDAEAYCKWAGKRLPTEAEWEKAARGDLVNKRYPWGNNLSRDDANYSGKGGKDIWKYSSPVGSFPKNGYGLYDMAGNVWEWCADWYDEKYYSISPKLNPKGPDSGKYKSLRGGSWYYNGNYGLRITYRFTGLPSLGNTFFGFRCVQPCE
jgi:formylglycine-generating enzyme required for sulfatase activity